MAVNSAVWGIDLGQSALKAMRCRLHEKDNRITADAFDIIEYPKILSQPEADPVELIHEALEQFLSRNSVRGDRVAISVPGQNGLARFIKLPPVESKKIPDIVKFEAKQQIPFSLDDVVWDFQALAGGSEEDGFALETEVGLFAMKREQVFRALKPFDDAGIEIDIVQLAPLCLYNFVVFDQMHNLPDPEDFDPEDPPESLVVISLGTDTTDLVITNGYRLWQRNIPIGGNHFTKVLSKELKLTFAKAEHLKRNAKQSEDPKAIFRAMRPVFNDLLTEVQRSIGFFNSIDRNAKISKVVGLGNAMKLPGLQRFVAQNLGYEVVRLDNYQRLSGRSVTDAPAFRDNMLAFPVCYGLALQGLRDVRIRTNLMPKEVLTERMIRAKKPWALAAAAALLLGFSASYFGYWKVWNTVQPTHSEGDVTFADAGKNVQGLTKNSQDFTNRTNSSKQAYNRTDSAGREMARFIPAQTRWLEVLEGIDACLPREPTGQELPPIEERNQLHIKSQTCSKVADVAEWYKLATENPKRYETRTFDEEDEESADTAPGGSNQPPGKGNQPPQPGKKPAGPKGEGFIFELVGYHYHNKKTDANSGKEYVLNTFVRNMQQAKIVRPDGSVVPVGDMGLGYAFVIGPPTPKWEHFIDDLGNVDPMKREKRGKAKNVPQLKQPIYSFRIQFCWVPKDPSEAAEATAVATNPRGRAN